MNIRFRAILVCFLLVSSFDAMANCTSGLVYQPPATFPFVGYGRMVYHAYAAYGDGSSHLYFYDFMAKNGGRLDQPSWNVIDPMNAQLSSDGKRLIFMANQYGRWHVFAWTFGSSTPPTNLTASQNANRSEDPKFSYNGKHVVYKQDGDIKYADIVFGANGSAALSRVTRITADGWSIEESMPYLTPSGKYLLFTRGAGASMDIYRTNLTNMWTEKVAAVANVADYYPVVRDYTAFFFTRWVDPSSRRDQIFINVLGTEQQLRLNECNADNSDAAPVNEDYMIFSSTSGSANYQLFLGDIKTGRVWLMPKSVNNLFGAPGGSALEKLGASYVESQ